MTRITSNEATARGITGATAIRTMLFSQYSSPCEVPMPNMITGGSSKGTDVRYSLTRITANLAPIIWYGFSGSGTRLMTSFEK